MGKRANKNNKKKTQRAKQRISGEREFVWGIPCGRQWSQVDQVGSICSFLMIVLEMVLEAQCTFGQPPFRKESSAGTSS